MKTLTLTVGLDAKRAELLETRDIMLTPISSEEGEYVYNTTLKLVAVLDELEKLGSRHAQILKAFDSNPEASIFDLAVANADWLKLAKSASGLLKDHLAVSRIMERSKFVSNHGSWEYMQ